ncbi:secreted RxLR effector protein 161-like [Nicotiana tabacum]|uniref:Secreted RxLR effector protein 161-like n=1 Tax=Nicotiana tabacum TaxID=4097 RepID=A0AC58RX21_TOBAC
MEDSKGIDTHIATSTKLDLDEPVSSVDKKIYRGMIESLLYLTVSRPDIVFSVGFCARFQKNPEESHLKAVKRILRYLKEQLIFAYGFLMDRKSTSGMTHCLGSCLVSWDTKKQNSVALSTAEAEYVDVASCYAQLLWIKQQLMDFGIDSYTRELAVKNLVHRAYKVTSGLKSSDVASEVAENLEKRFVLVGTIARVETGVSRTICCKNKK